jgi:hypothetical protein
MGNRSSISSPYAREFGIASRWWLDRRDGAGSELDPIDVAAKFTVVRTQPEAARAIDQKGRGLVVERKRLPGREIMDHRIRRELTPGMLLA